MSLFTHESFIKTEMTVEIRIAKTEVLAPTKFLIIIMLTKRPTTPIEGTEFNQIEFLCKITTGRTFVIKLL